MAGARQETSIQSALVSIFKKIDTMVDSIVSTNDSNLVVLGNIEKVVTSDVSKELKKQTVLLSEIKAKLLNRAEEKEEQKTKSESDKKNFAMFGSAFVSIVKAADKISLNTTKNLKGFFTVLRTSLSELTELDLSKIANVGSAINAILAIGKNSLKFAGYMVLFTILAPVIKIGIGVLAWTLNSFNKLTLPDEKVLDGVSNLIAMGGKILLFGLAMAAFAIVAIPAILGTLAFVVMVKILNLLLSVQDAKQLEGLSIVLKIGAGILLFGLALAAFAYFAPKIIIGTLLAAGAIVLISLALLLLDRVKSAEKTLLWVSLGLVTLGLSLFAFNSLVDPVKTLGSLLVIVGVGLAFAFIGIFDSYIKKGAIAMILASIPIVILSISMAIWQTAGVTWNSIGQILALVTGVGVVMGVAGLAFPYIALGAIAMGLSAVAVLAMTWALKEFQTLKWEKKDSDNLKYVIKSVLEALSGTDSSKGALSNISSAATQGLSAIISLFSIGALILGSAAIYVMSIALEKFKSLGWTPGDTTSLSGVITGVLDAISKKSSPYGQPSVGGQILDTMISIMSGGALIVGSVAIWMLSLALEKYKSIGWTPELTANLASTITGVLGALGGTNTVKVNPGMGILQTILSLIGAGSIFVAGGGIWLFAEALQKFKNVKWNEGKNDSQILTNTITGVLNILTNADAGKAEDTAETLGDIGDYLEDFFSGLQKFKNLNWWNKDTLILKGAIDMILGFDTSQSYDGLDRVARNFRSMASSMGVMKAQINAIDIKKLTLTESMMKSLAALAKNPNAIAATIRTSIEQSFDRMTKEMNDILTNVMKNNSASISKSFTEAINANKPTGFQLGVPPITNQAPTTGLTPAKKETPKTPEQLKQEQRMAEMELKRMADLISKEFVAALMQNGIRVYIDSNGFVKSNY